MKRGLVALLIGFAVLVPNAPASSCQKWCSARFTVGTTLERWRSPQVFRRDPDIEVELRVGSRKPEPRFLSPCRARLYAGGAALAWNSCARRARIRAVALWPVVVTVRYRIG